MLLLPLSLLAVSKITELRRSAAAIPANIIVDASITQGKIPSSLWQNFAQGGEEPVDMIGPVATTAALLSPKLIRIDHVFDFFNVVQGPGLYDFSFLDKEINSILATGAKPMISLSYTPDSMAKNHQNANEPNNWDDWYNLVKATASHYSVDLKIDGIYYEVWNEPDLFGHWHIGRSPDYNTLYLQTASAVLSGAPTHNYKIGGPATTAYYPDWIKALFTTAADNHLPLDFVSWHRYSKDAQGYKDDAEKLGQVLTQYPQYFNLEKIISEAGPDSEPSVWYDNQLSGIHLMAMSTQLAGTIHRLFSFELVDGPSPRSAVSTGWGMLTHSGVAKPRFYAVEFLNRLAGDRLSSVGDGSFITSLSSKNNSTYQTLLVNYDPDDQHVETAPLTINNLPNGQYTVKISTFLGKINTKTTTVTNGVYQDQFYFDPNTAILVELTAQ